MAHQPVQATETARCGVGLQVSGHTHSGQMFPFGQVINLQQPILSGYGEVDGALVYVTNGVGYWGLVASRDHTPVVRRRAAVGDRLLDEREGSRSVATAAAG